MIYQFIKAYGNYGLNPDFLNNFNGEHRLYAFLFLSQISRCDDEAKTALFDHIGNKAQSLFQGDELDRVT